MKNLFRNYLKILWHSSASLNNEILASYIEQGGGLKVLDVGCDEGSIFLRRVEGKVKHPKLYGVDINPEKIRQARKKGIIAITRNVEQPLPYKSNFFDVVSANQIIEHLINVDQFVKEMYRVLKPGGYLVLATENLASWHNIFALLLGWQAFSQHLSVIKNIGNPLRISKVTGYESNRLHIKIFTPRGLRELVELHGFTVETVYGAGCYPFPGGISKILSRIDPTHAAFIGLKARKPEKR